MGTSRWEKKKRIELSWCGPIAAIRNCDRQVKRLTPLPDVAHQAFRPTGLLV